jgi:hypothetical protein
MIAPKIIVVCRVIQNYPQDVGYTNRSHFVNSKSFTSCINFIVCMHSLIEYVMISCRSARKFSVNCCVCSRMTPVLLIFCKAYCTKPCLKGFVTLERLYGQKKIIIIYVILLISKNAWACSYIYYYSVVFHE